MGLMVDQPSLREIIMLIRDPLGDLFQDLEQVSTDVGESALSETETPHESRTLGLGLAVVARIVRNMDGQLRLKSEEGKGSRFVIQLPFELPTEDTLRKAVACPF